MTSHSIIQQLKTDADGCEEIAEGYLGDSLAEIAMELAVFKRRAVEIAPSSLIQESC